MIIFLSILALVIFSNWLFLQHPQFGKLPSGGALEQIKHSPHYKEGQFQNLNFTPMMTDGASTPRIMYKFFFAKNKRNKPSQTLPSVKTDLLNLDLHKNCLVWFGHSSYFLQIDGKRILVDPVFSGSVSPLPVGSKSYPGTDIYTTEDFPELDYLFITHDHWDHLDYKTVIKFKTKVKKVITGIGTGAHLEYWGYAKEKIIEKDWNEEITLDDGFMVYTKPARHFSGRGLKRNQSQWMSFVLQTPSMKFYLGGDSGYDTHFKTIGDQFGPFDLAILECGQYNSYWKYIHMMPEEVVQAGFDLNAKKIMPVHWGKFTLSLAAWDEPIIRVTAEAAKRNLPVLHPLIGEAIDLDNPATPVRWWEGID